jgi:hypothetical protein
MGSTVSIDSKNKHTVICAFEGPTSNLLACLLYTNGIVYGYIEANYIIKFYVESKHEQTVFELCKNWHITIST